jgi:hypothetical protein
LQGYSEGGKPLPGMGDVNRMRQAVISPIETLTGNTIFLRDDLRLSSIG